MADSDKIKLALGQLDHTNDAHWTEDGLPRTGVVQQLANDPTIKRTDINAASPGFVRKSGDEMGDPEEHTGAQPPAPAPEGDGIVTAAGDLQPGVEYEELSEEEVHAILTQNIKDAQQAVTQAQKNVLDAQKAELDARKALAAANKELMDKFPPLTPAENIQQYLRSEHAKRAAAHGVQLPDAVDQAFVRGNSRRWVRPVHTAGGVVVPVPQSGFSRKTVDGAVPQSKTRPSFARPTRPAVGLDGKLVQPGPRGVVAQ